MNLPIQYRPAEKLQCAVFTKSSFMRGTGYSHHLAVAGNSSRQPRHKVARGQPRDAVGQLAVGCRGFHHEVLRLLRAVLLPKELMCLQPGRACLVCSPQWQVQRLQGRANKEKVCAPAARMHR